jgi:hypothetical protein
MNTNNASGNNDIKKPKTAIENEIEALRRTNRLPFELVDIIQSYVNPIAFVFTNKTNYVKYHSCIKPIIIKAKKFENYIRDIVRRDNAFVFDYILKENCLKWFHDYKYYVYQNITYKNYIYFLLDFCIEHDSNKCRVTINTHLDELGLSKKST